LNQLAKIVDNNYAQIYSPNYAKLCAGTYKENIMWNELKIAEKNLSETLAIVRALLEANDPLRAPAPPATNRNPAYFKNGGQGKHLSELGIQKIYQLFDAGETTENVAFIMGISIKGAQLRKTEWNGRRMVRERRDQDAKENEKK
jgi:hypothetical protein